MGRFEPTPAESFRHRSVSLLSAVNVALPVEPASGLGGIDTRFDGNVNGMFGTSVNVRGVISGVMLGAEVGVTFADRVLPGAVFTPGVTAGFVVPLLPRLTASFAMHGILVASTAPDTPLDAQITGDAALECFVGRHAFIEPVVELGGFFEPALNVGFFVVGVGYRLGVSF